jgi:hypothetical protein
MLNGVSTMHRPSLTHSPCARSVAERDFSRLQQVAVDGRPFNGGTKVQHRLAEAENYLSAIGLRS